MTYLQKLLSGASNKPISNPNSDPLIPAPWEAQDLSTTSLKLVGASLDGEEREAANMLGLLTKTREMIETEITRLAAELHATDVALAARKAMLGVLTTERETQDAAVGVLLSDEDMQRPFDPAENRAKLAAKKANERRVAALADSKRWPRERAAIEAMEADTAATS